MKKGEVVGLNILKTERLPLDNQMIWKMSTTVLGYIIPQGLYRAIQKCKAESNSFVLIHTTIPSYNTLQFFTNWLGEA